MKKIFAAAMLLVLCAVAACDTLDEQFVFYINKEKVKAITPAFPVGQLTVLDNMTILANADTVFMRNRTRAELVKEMTLDKFTLSITDSTGIKIDSTSADFDFLESVDVYISADSLEEVRVAYLEDIPANDSTLNYAINLNLTNVKLDAYLKKDKYIIQTRGRLRKAVADTVLVGTAVLFKAIADPI